MGLKRKEANYEWHETNPLQTITFEAAFDSLTVLSNTCGFQNWTSPEGYDTCPLCTYVPVVENGNRTGDIEQICLHDNLASSNCTSVEEKQVSGQCVCGTTNRDRGSTSGSLSNVQNVTLHSTIVMLMFTLLLTSLFEK